MRSFKAARSLNYPIAKINLPDMSERLIHGAILGLALVLLEIGLQLLLGFLGVGHEFAPRAECKFANVAIRGAGSASDESDDDEFAIRHRAIMAGPLTESQIAGALGAF